MRKIVVSQFLTLDGVMEAPEKWNTQYLNDAELVSELLADFHASDALLLGRISYDFFAERWPSRTGEMANQFNMLTKYVVSGSMQEASWNNSTIINGDISAAIKKIKQQRGKNILVPGSYQLVQMLMKENLINEYKLFIYPLTLGKGKRLFEYNGQRLKLMKSKCLASGVVALTYQPE